MTAINNGKQMTLRQMLRSNTVKRWHIVDTSKQQTIAEHSFNMCLLVEEICKLVGQEDQTDAAIRYTIHHDIPEVVLGDIPTPTKRFYGLMNALGESGLDPQSAAPNGFIEDVVKLADLLDAVMFLQLYGIGKHSQDVRADLVERIYNMDIIRFGYEEKLRQFVFDVISWETVSDDCGGRI